MDAKLLKSVSRFVVPFYYDYGNDGYEKLKNHFLGKGKNFKELELSPKGEWVSAGFWENYKSDKETQAEMDLYSYLPSVFSEEKNTNKKDVSNLGISLVYKAGGKLFELNHKSFTFDLEDLGILLLRNGIGFIWYETKFNDAVSIDEYVEFLNRFKELARTHDKSIKKKTNYDEKEKKTIYEPFCLGKWLSEFIAADDLGITFWAERESKAKNGGKIRIPDKALLFQYLFIEPVTENDRNNLVFRIANGYDEKYNVPESIDASVYKPFGNISYYVTDAGMACVATDDETNSKFLKEGFPEKYVRDYFFIYLLLLYQSYSCSHYSRLLTKLPAEEKMFNKKPAYIDKLESLDGQINLFLVKSVFESVSNIHHQNGMYRYGKNMLCIEEDIRSLTVGLDALENMEKEKRSRKVDLALGVFGIIVAISVLIDGLNLVDWFLKNNGDMNWRHWVVCGAVILPALYLICTLFRNRKKK